MTSHAYEDHEGNIRDSSAESEEIPKDDPFDTAYFDMMKQASKEAEKPVLRLTKSQLRKIFRKLNKFSMGTCQCSDDTYRATLKMVERTLQEKGGFV